MQKLAIISAIALVSVIGSASPAAAQRSSSAFRTRVFNPFTVQPTVERRFSLANFGLAGNNPFASLSNVEDVSLTSESETPLSLLTVPKGSPELPAPALGMGGGAGGGRPPYTPPVRSPFRPPPRPPFIP